MIVSNMSIELWLLLAQACKIYRVDLVEVITPGGKGHSHRDRRIMCAKIYIAAYYYKRLYFKYTASEVMALIALPWTTYSDHVINPDSGRLGVASIYEGVSYQKSKKRWVAYTTDAGGKYVYLGVAHSEDEARKIFETFKKRNPRKESEETRGRKPRKPRKHIANENTKKTEAKVRRAKKK